MNKKALIIGMSIAIGGITANVVRNIIVKRKELIEGAINNDEL